MDSLASLIAKLEAAEAGSSELDFWWAYHGGQLNDVLPRGCSRIEGGEREVIIYDRDGKRSGWVGYHCFGPVTQSLDAAVSATEEALPGWNWCVARDAGATDAARCRAWVQSETARKANPLGGPSYAAATAPLAICIAVLSVAHLDRTLRARSAQMNMEKG